MVVCECMSNVCVYVQMGTYHGWGELGIRGRRLACNSGYSLFL